MARQLLEMRDRKDSLEAAETGLRETLKSLLGDDPQQWPKLARDVGGMFRPYWPRTADDRLLATLRENGIPLPEQPVYDVDGMVQALRNAGVAVEPFIKDRQVDVSTAVKALEILNIPRSGFQSPCITLLDKRPKPEPVADMTPAMGRKP
jgi:hypothetical protein